MYWFRKLTLSAPGTPSLSPANTGPRPVEYRLQSIPFLRKKLEVQAWGMLRAWGLHPADKSRAPLGPRWLSTEIRPERVASEIGDSFPRLPRPETDRWKGENYEVNVTE